MPSFTRNQFLVGGFAHSQRDGAPEGVQGAIRPLVASRRSEILCNMGKVRKALSLASTRNQFLVGRFRPPAGGRGTFPHGKVPKGCRGRPKGACRGRPRTPVAKLQCTASLAGAPARFTSVPGRPLSPTAQLIPGSMAPVYPWSVGKGPPRQHPCARYAPRLRCHARCARRGARLVAGPRPNQMACRYGPCRSEAEDVSLPDKGGPGVSLGRLKGYRGSRGHRGRSKSPCPLSGGANAQRRILYSIKENSVVVVIMQVEISTNQYIVGLVAQ